MEDLPSDFAPRSWLPLLALSMASFGIGTTEFVIMGLLPDVAHDLAVTIPQAGLLVSGYALGVALVRRFSRSPQRASNAVWHCCCSSGSLFSATASVQSRQVMPFSWVLGSSLHFPMAHSSGSARSLRTMSRSRRKGRKRSR